MDSRQHFFGVFGSPFPKRMCWQLIAASSCFDPKISLHEKFDNTGFMWFSKEHTFVGNCVFQLEMSIVLAFIQNMLSVKSTRNSQPQGVGETRGVVLPLNAKRYYSNHLGIRGERAT